MKLLRSALVLGLLPFALAKSIIVTYPKDTPESVIKHDKASLKKAGGHITHEYKLFKGFSADAPDHAIQVLSTESTKYRPYIEEEQIVTAVGNS